MTYRNDDSYTDYSVKVEAVTAKAIKVQFLALDQKSDAMVWIPKSVCQNSDQKLEELDRGDIVELRIADWFAQKNGFLA